MVNEKLQQLLTRVGATPDEEGLREAARALQRAGYVEPVVLDATLTRPLVVPRGAVLVVTTTQRLPSFAHERFAEELNGRGITVVLLDNGTTATALVHPEVAEQVGRKNSSPSLTSRAGNRAARIAMVG